MRRRYFLATLGMFLGVSPPGGAGAVCQDALALRVDHPVPLYSASQPQAIRWTASNGGSATAYLPTVTTQPGSFSDRTYVGSSFSTTTTGGLTVQPSWATAFSGPWTDGEPADGTGEPLFLRWRISSMFPGSTSSVEVSWRVLVVGGPEAPLPTVLSATWSCDAAETIGEILPYSATATGGRIAPPLMGLQVTNAPANGDEHVSAVALDAAGSVFVAGQEQAAAGGRNWRVRKFDPALGSVLASTDYNGPLGSTDLASALAVDGSGNVLVAGYEGAPSGGNNWRIRRYDPGLGTLLSEASYDGPAGGADYARALSIAASGNVVVAGLEGAGAAADNWRVRTYDATLTIPLGSTDYNGPGNDNDGVYGVAHDADGNVVVAGYEMGSGGNWNWRIRKYDPTLTVLLGSTDYNGPGNGADTAYAVRIDPLGRILVIGSEFAGPNYNWRIRKYDGALSMLLATVSYNGPGNANDDASAAMLDANGNLVVAGTEAGAAGGANWRIRKYDNALNLVDSMTHNGLAGGTDNLFGLAAVGSASVYAGGDETVTGEGQNAAVARVELAAFSPPGAPAALTATGGPGRVDLTWLPATAGTRALSGYRVYRQTYAGLPQGAWLAQVDGATASIYADLAVVNGATYVYRVLAVDVAGAESGTSPESPAVPVAICVPALSLAARQPEPLYAAAGEQQLWRFAFSNGSTQTVYNVTLTADAATMNQRLYRAPSFSATRTGGGPVTPSWAFSAAGPWTDGEPADGTGVPLVLRWTIPVLGPGETGEVSFRGVLTAGIEEPVYGIASATLSCDPAGSNGASLGYSVSATGRRIVPPLLAVRTHDGPDQANDNANACAVDGTGGLVAAGSESAGSNRWVIRRYDGQLNLLATVTHDPSPSTDRATAIAVDGAGNVFVGGYLFSFTTGMDWRILKYDGALGGVLASVDHTGAGNNTDLLNALAVAGDGTILAAGSEAGGAGGVNWRVSRYSADLGALLATTAYDGPASATDEAWKVATGPDGSVYVAGVEQGLAGGADWRVIRYDATLSTVLGSTSFNGAGNLTDAAFGLAVDGGGNVFVAGSEFGADFTFNWRIRKYDAALGTLLAGTDYRGAGGNADMPHGLALDAAGNLLVAGYEFGATGGDNWVVRKYDNALNLIDAQVRNGLAGGNDQARFGIAASGTATVFIPGVETVAGNAEDFAVAKYALAAFLPPGPPTGLTAAGGEGRIDLAWSPASAGTRALSGYRIYRQTFAGVTQGALLAEIVGAAATGYGDPAAVPGTTYHYRVLALDVAGAESRLSLEAAAVAVPPVAALSGALSVSPAPVGVGQPILVTMTVTDTGAGSALDVTATLWVMTGTGSAAYAAGPFPAVAGTLFGGSAMTFTWTFTAASSGTVYFAGSATGVEAGTLTVRSTGLVYTATPTTIQPAAGLVAAASASPGTAVTGQYVTVAVTVTNTGGTTATGVAPALSLAGGSGTAGLGDGPAPVSVSIVPGGSQTFVWTWTASGAGSLNWAVTVSGTDALTAAPLVAVSGAAAQVLAAATLVASVSVPASPVPVGRWFTVSLTATNPGQEAVTGAVPALEVVSGSVVAQGGVTPAGPQFIPGGGSATWRWTYSVSGAGIIGFSGTAAGTAALGGGPVAGSAGNSVLALYAAFLTASASVASPSAKVGDRVFVTLVVSNAGSASASAFVPSLAVTGAAGVVALSAGGTPVSSTLVLAPGSSIAFTWTFTAQAAGTAICTAAVTAVDLGVSAFIGAAAAPIGVTVTAGQTVGQQVLGRTSTPVVPFPNPVPRGADTVNVAIRLPENMTQVTVEVFNSAMRLVQRQTYYNVTVADGGVAVSGVRSWAPGIYFVRVAALCEPGHAPKIYPLVKVVVK